VELFTGIILWQTNLIEAAEKEREREGGKQHLNFDAKFVRIFHVVLISLP